jgi:hypothetical protein
MNPETYNQDAKFLVYFKDIDVAPQLGDSDISIAQINDVTRSLVD